LFILNVHFILILREAERFEYTPYSINTHKQGFYSEKFL